MHRSYIVTQMT